MANRSRGAFDVILDSGDLIMGFNLAHEVGTNGRAKPAVVTAEVGPGRVDEQVSNADVPRVIDNLDAGMGFSRRIEAVPNGYAYTLPGYCRSPGGIFGPAGKVTEIELPPITGVGAWNESDISESFRFTTPSGDTVYLISGSTDVLALIPDGTRAFIANRFPAGFRGIGGAVFNNRLYVSGDAGIAYLDGVTGAWSAVSPIPRRKMKVVNWRPLGVPTDVLVAISPEYSWNAIRWCPITADPMVAGSWSAPVRIGGDLRYPIHQLVAAPRRVYMLRPDGVYEIDELGTRAYNIAPWVSEAVDNGNGSWGTHLGAGLHYMHSQGLAYIPTSGELQVGPEWCHPGWGLPYEGPVRGKINTGTMHNGWGMLGQWMPGGQQTYIVAGRRAQDLAYGQATHIWHGAEAVVEDLVQHMRVYTLAYDVDQPKMLMTTRGAEVGTASVRAFWQSLPSTGSPLQEMIWGGHFVPADAASLFLPADPWNRPSAVKTLLQLDLVTERLNLGTDLFKAYAAADEGDFVEQGVAETGSYTSLVPLELTEGRYIRTRVDALGSPILRSLELRAALGFDLREARVYRLVLGWDNALKTPRSRENRDPEQRMLDLKTMLGRVVVLEDPYPMRVRVLQVMTPERRQIGPPNRAGAWALVVPIMVSILDHPFRRDGSARYDTDRTWG